MKIRNKAYLETGIRRGNRPFEKKKIKERRRVEREKDRGRKMKERRGKEREIQKPVATRMRQRFKIERKSSRAASTAIAAVANNRVDTGRIEIRLPPPLCTLLRPKNNGLSFDTSSENKGSGAAT